MIKKNTKLIFKDGEDIETYDLIGGMPLAQGETVNFQLKGQDEIVNYRVVNKTTNLLREGEDWIVSIIYTLERK